MCSKLLKILILSVVVLTLVGCYFSGPIVEDVASSKAGITVSLNNQWRTFTGSGPSYDSSSYYCYESYSNHNVASSDATMEIKVKNNTSSMKTLEIYVASCGETTYDYTIVYDIDSSSSIFGTTSGRQEAYYKASFSIPTGTHTIRIKYTKDSSTNVSYDRGYVLVPKEW